jgi:hypothetical protein
MLGARLGHDWPRGWPGSLAAEAERQGLATVRCRPPVRVEAPADAWVGPSVVGAVEPGQPSSPGGPGDACDPVDLGWVAGRVVDEEQLDRRCSSDEFIDLVAAEPLGRLPWLECRATSGLDLITFTEVRGKGLVLGPPKSRAGVRVVALVAYRWRCPAMHLVRGRWVGMGFSLKSGRSAVRDRPCPPLSPAVITDGDDCEYP